MQGLFTPQKLQRISSSTVAVFGLGGVGGYALEALARSGVGKFYLIDGDVIEPSNINRQLLALTSTIGMPKVEVAKIRVKEINEDAVVFTCFKMLKPDRDAHLNLSFLDEADAIVDATDDVSLKAFLALQACKRECVIISAGGAGNRIDSSGFCIEDIYKTSGCPLCRALRQRLRRLQVSRLPVVYAKDGNMSKPQKEKIIEEERVHSITSTASISSTAWTPAIAGLMMAEYVIRML